MEIKDIYKLYSQNFLVDTDTRKIRENSIFFCLKGENFNGNKFAQKAISLGASYAIIDEQEYKTHPNIILVENALKALQELANFHRKQFKFPIIGLTGSNGKTTTKELIHTVLKRKYKTTATKGNLNNHIGVPLTILSMNLDTEIGIVEMGANHQKEIELLSSICEPDYGYITNFGKAHLEGFGGIEGVIKGKSELYEFLEKNNKTAFVNPKDKIQLKKTKNIKTIAFDNSLQFLDVNPFVKFSLKNLTIQSNLIGEYNFNNIAIACTIANYFNISIKDIKSAIESYYPENNRSQIIKTSSNDIILDAYNANPSSMKVAIENFSSLKAKHKTLILGDMFELGKESLNEHKAIADLVEENDFSQYYFVGDNFYQAKSSNRFFRTFDDLKNYLQNNPLKQQSILIKGSRGMRLERLLDIIN